MKEHVTSSELDHCLLEVEGVSVEIEVLQVWQQSR